MQSQQYTIAPYSENSWLIQFDPQINAATNNVVLAVCKLLRDCTVLNIVDIVPAYSSVLVYTRNLILNTYILNEVKINLEKVVDEALRSNLQIDKVIETKRIPVCYDMALGNDLKLVEQHTNLSMQQIIQLHTSQVFNVYMVGFLPGFAYMGTLPEALHIARKNNPVATVAGSVGIASQQTGIYPFNSPGGWHIIGHTPLKMFCLNRPQPSLLQVGQQVQFYTITLSEYYKMHNL